MTPCKATPATDGRQPSSPRSTGYTKVTQRLVALTFLFACLLPLAACQTADSSLAAVRSSGTLRVGLDPTYPPFEVAEGDTVTGLDVDLARELAAGLGTAAQPVTPTFTYFGYDGLYDALLTDQVDVLISALVVSPERTRDFAYSHAYYDAGQVLLVPPGSAVAGTDDLADRRVAVELGALGHVEALALQRTHPNVTVLPYPSADEALSAVAAGEADAALVDSISGRLFLQAAPAANPPLRLLPDPVISEPFAVVVRIEDETLLAELDTQLAQMESDGRLAALVSRWLGP